MSEPIRRIGPRLDAEPVTTVVPVRISAEERERRRREAEERRRREAAERDRREAEVRGRREAEERQRQRHAASAAPSRPDAAEPGSADGRPRIDVRA